MGADMAPFSYFIFDLDGTILDTILDISLAMNEALRRCGYSYSYTREETMRLVGDGADKCVERALAFHNEDLRGFSRLKAEYMPLYKQMQNDHACPFSGEKEALQELKDAGAKLYVCTNKPDALAQVVVKAHYGEGFFEGILGAREGVPVKPDPTSLNELVERFGIDKHRALYIGDSSVDLDTADNGGILSVLCLWGYGIYDQPTKERAYRYIEKPSELLDFLDLPF